MEIFTQIELKNDEILSGVKIYSNFAREKINLLTEPFLANFWDKWKQDLSNKIHFDKTSFFNKIFVKKQILDLFRVV